MLRRLCLGVLLFGVLAAPAAAQIPPPSLTTDTAFAFAGVSEYDFGLGSADQAARAAVDPALDRYYAVGSTAGQIAVVARQGRRVARHGVRGRWVAGLARGRVGQLTSSCSPTTSCACSGVSAGGDIVDRRAQPGRHARQRLAGPAASRRSRPVPASDVAGGLALDRRRADDRGHRRHRRSGTRSWPRSTPTARSTGSRRRARPRARARIDSRRGRRLGRAAHRSR